MCGSISLPPPCSSLSLQACPMLSAGLCGCCVLGPRTSGTLLSPWLKELPGCQGPGRGVGPPRAVQQGVGGRGPGNHLQGAGICHSLSPGRELINIHTHWSRREPARLLLGVIGAFLSSSDCRGSPGVGCGSGWERKGQPVTTGGECTPSALTPGLLCGDAFRPGLPS